MEESTAAGAWADRWKVAIEKRKKKKVRNDRLRTWRK